MKYIDAEKLIAEIERRLEKYDPNYTNAGSELKELLSFITFLQQEQSEVDLEKELDKWRHDHFKGKRDGNYSGEYLERESQLVLARHFYELGLNARKED